MTPPNYTILAILAIMLTAIVIYIIMYNHKVDTFRKSISIGMECSIWLNSECAYIKAKIDCINHIEKQVCVLVDGEKTVRLMPLNQIYPKSFVR